MRQQLLLFFYATTMILTYIIFLLQHLAWKVVLPAVEDDIYRTGDYAPRNQLQGCWTLYTLLFSSAVSDVWNGTTTAFA